LGAHHRPLQFLFATLSLTPHQIDIGQNIILIINTLHDSEVFTTPITTFEETFDWQKVTIAPTCLQILNQVELMEETNAKFIEGIVNQQIVKDQKNFEL
jgi:hypothetical protein